MSLYRQQYYHRLLSEVDRSLLKKGGEFISMKHRRHPPTLLPRRVPSGPDKLGIYPPNNTPPFNLYEYNEELLALAKEKGYEVFEIKPRIEHYPRYCLYRSGKISSPSVYIGSGIHGEEQAGPRAILELIKQDAFGDGDVLLIPTINSRGLHHGKRRNCSQGLGSDINGIGENVNLDYLKTKRTTLEVKGHIAMIRKIMKRRKREGKKKPFDVAFDLHEDQTIYSRSLSRIRTKPPKNSVGSIFEGSYLYSSSQNPKLASAMAKVLQRITGLAPAKFIGGYSVPRPGIQLPTSQLHSSLVEGHIPKKLQHYARQFHTGYLRRANIADNIYYIETHSLKLPFKTRIAAHVAAIKTAIGFLEKESAGVTQHRKLEPSVISTKPLSNAPHFNIPNSWIRSR